MNFIDKAWLLQYRIERWFFKKRYAYQDNIELFKLKQIESLDEVHWIHWINILGIGMFGVMHMIYTWPVWWLTSQLCFILAVLYFMWFMIDLFFTNPD